MNQGKIKSILRVPHNCSSELTDHNYFKSSNFRCRVETVYILDLLFLSFAWIINITRGHGMPFVIILICIYSVCSGFIVPCINRASNTLKFSRLNFFLLPYLWITGYSILYNIRYVLIIVPHFIFFLVCTACVPMILCS